MNKDKDNELITNPEKESGFVDTARMDVQCHILIKDKDTNQVLLNKRG